MREASWRPIVGLSLVLVLGACTNGGKNVRDTTGMTPGSAAGQVGGAGTTTGAVPAVPSAATADSNTSRRDTLGGRMSHMMRDSAGRMSRMMRDTADCRKRSRDCRRP